MKNINQSIIEIKESKTGSPIPIVNGVHLHSSYNPTKEAEVFVERFQAQLEANRFVLILGLGFAYHIDRIVYQMKRTWGDQFQVLVIDPLLRTEELLNTHRTIEYGKKVVIYSGLTVSEIYDNRDIVDFLALKPTVIPHTSSFNLFQSFFKSFMSHSSKCDIESIASHIQDIEFKKYLIEEDNKSYFEFVNNVSSKRDNWNKWDFLVLALNSITSPENTATNRDLNE